MMLSYGKKICLVRRLIERLFFAEERFATMCKVEKSF